MSFKILGAISCAVYLINRTPRESLEWRTPYQQLYNKIPDISNLVPFYSPGKVFIPKEDRKHNLSKRAYDCRMIGYDDEGKNTYLVYIPELKEIKRARSVIFDEGINFQRNQNERDLYAYDRYKNLSEKVETISNDSNFFETITKEVIDTSIIPETINKINIGLPTEPKTIKEAINCKESKYWINAIEAELNQLKEMGTFELVNDIKGKRVAKMKFVFQVSYDNAMNIKYKARLVLCGYSQIFGIDYKETFSPTISRDSLIIVLFVAIKRNFFFELIDVKGAFLEDIIIMKYMVNYREIFYQLEHQEKLSN